jgi:basic membrane protein A
MVGMAYDVGGRGDQSFNDAAAAGLDKAAGEFGFKPQEATAVNGENDAAREERLNQLVDAGFTHIIAVGFAYAGSVGKVAKENPDVHFAIIDDASDASKGDNVAQLTFAENEGSFLVGAAAALKSKAGHVGFVGGVNVPLINKFEAGYVAGAKAVNPDIKIESNYLTQPPDVSGFGDPAKGETAADGMFQKGADIVYHAAGGSGGGVFAAAKKAKGWAIGVDSDQALTAEADVRDVILTSMLKKLDVAVYDYLKDAQGGEEKSGNIVYDLKAGGVDYATTGGHIDDIKPKLDEYKAKIISGEIKVPDSM